MSQLCVCTSAHLVPGIGERFGEEAIVHSIFIGDRHSSVLYRVHTPLPGLVENRAGNIYHSQSEHQISLSTCLTAVLYSHKDCTVRLAPPPPSINVGEHLTSKSSRNTVTVIIAHV